MDINNIQSNTKQENQLLELELLKANLQNYLDFLELRKYWFKKVSRWILCFIVGHFTIIGVLIIGIFFRYINFIDIKWIITVMVAHNFFSIIGFGYIITKGLYPQQPPKT